MKSRFFLYPLVAFAVLGVLGLIYWPDIQEMRRVQKEEEAIANMSREQELKIEAIKKAQVELRQRMSTEATLLTNDELLTRIKTESAIFAIRETTMEPHEILTDMLDTSNMESIVKLSSADRSFKSIEFFKILGLENLYFVETQPSGDKLYFEIQQNSVSVSEHKSSLESWIDFFTALKFGKVFKEKRHNRDLIGQESSKGKVVVINNIKFTIADAIANPESVKLLKKFSNFSFFTDESGAAYIGLDKGQKIPVQPIPESVYESILKPLNCLPVYKNIQEKSSNACRPLTEKEFPFTQVCEGAERGLLQIQSEISTQYECFLGTYLEGVDACESDQDCHLIERATYSLLANTKSKSKVDGFLVEAYRHVNHLSKLYSKGAPKCNKGRCMGLFHPEGYP